MRLSDWLHRPVLRSAGGQRLGISGSTRLAESQRSGAYVWLAVSSALLVLLASGVAISRIGDRDHVSRVASTPERPSPTGTDAPSGAAASGAASGPAASVPGAPVAPSPLSSNAGAMVSTSEAAVAAA